MNITNYELLNALVDSTSTMNNWITNCRTCEECEKCALFPCIAIKQTDKNKVIINSWIMNCRKYEECKRCAVFPCASVKPTNNEIDMSKITVNNSESYWEQNANYPNDYDLIKIEYIMGKSMMFDKWETRIYGWVHEVIIGENKGKIEAGYPTPYDEEIGSDAISLGYFDNIQDAMKAVLESNHPDYSGYYI